MSTNSDALKPDDFPLELEGKKVYAKGKPEPLIEASSETVAKDIADRLNLDELDRQEEDWSL